MRKIGSKLYIADDGEQYVPIAAVRDTGVILMARQVDFFRDVVPLFATSIERFNKANSEGEENQWEKGDAMTGLRHLER